MGVTNRLTQHLDVIKFILTIVSASYKAIIRSNLQRENYVSIYLEHHFTHHSSPPANGSNTQKGKDNEKILTTEHPAAYLHNKFSDTIVRYLILIISCNGIPQNTKLS
jgi:hypothetical protein